MKINNLATPPNLCNLVPGSTRPGRRPASWYLSMKN